MAILLFLLGIIAVNGRSILQYTSTSAISIPFNDMSYTAENPDNAETALQGPYSAWLDDDCKAAQVDDDTSTGCQVKAAANQFTYGISTSEQTAQGRTETVGMKGQFYAIDIEAGDQGYTYYDVTKLTISFKGGCLSDMDLIAEDSSIYYTKNGDSIVDSKIKLYAEKVSGVTTYSLNVCIYIYAHIRIISYDYVYYYKYRLMRVQQLNYLQESQLVLIFKQIHIVKLVCKW